MKVRENRLIVEQSYFSIVFRNTPRYRDSFHFEIKQIIFFYSAITINHVFLNFLLQRDPAAREKKLRGGYFKLSTRYSFSTFVGTWVITFIFIQLFFNQPEQQVVYNFLNFMLQYLWCKYINISRLTNVYLNACDVAFTFKADFFVLPFFAEP